MKQYVNIMRDFKVAKLAYLYCPKGRETLDDTEGY
jgi:hypothetical protein